MAGASARLRGSESPNSNRSAQPETKSRLCRWACSAMRKWRARMQGSQSAPSGPGASEARSCVSRVAMPISVIRRWLRS